ncbi:MAG: mechanosensitive ion channel [Myxococcales bacterium]|nr:mechanosensitive ion channel [Myxococcales bacterium]
MFRWLCLLVCTSATIAGPGLAQPLTAPTTSEAGGVEPGTPDDDERVGAELERLASIADQWLRKADEYRTAWEQAPRLLADIEREIARLGDRESLRADPRLSVSELEAELQVAEQQLTQAQMEATELDDEAARRIERRKRIPELLADRRTQLRALADETTPDAVAPRYQDAAAATLKGARMAALEAELDSYKNELASYDARGALLAKRRDRAALAIAYYGTLVSRLQDALKERQRRALAAQSAEAQRLLSEIAGLPGEVRRVASAIAEQNASLAELWVGEEGLVEKLETVTARLTRARAAVSEIESDLSALSAKVDAVGLEDTVGALLRRERAEVPDVGMYRRFVRMRQDQIGAAQLQQLRLQERRDDLSDLDGLVQLAMDGLSKPLNPQERAQAQRVLRGLYAHQRQYMDALVVDYETYFQRLVDFDAEQRTLIERSEALIEFIDQRVLWMPSGGPIGVRTLSDAAQAVAWLVSPHLWQQLGHAAIRLLRNRTLSLCGLAVVLAVMLASRGRLRRRLSMHGSGQHRSEDPWTALATLQSLLVTTTLALWPPALLTVLAFLMLRSPDATAFTRAIAYGVCVASGYWGTLRFGAFTMFERGLAQTRAGWHGPSLARVRRHVRWLTWVTVPAVFLVFTFDKRGEDAARESLGRLAFIVAVLATALFLHILLRPRGAWAEVLRRRHGRSRRGWLRPLLHMVGAAGPVALGVASALGFYWTALQLGIREHLSIILLFVLVLSVDTVRLLTRRAERRLATQRAQRAVAQAAETAGTHDGRLSASASLPVVEDEVDLEVVSRQTGRLTFAVAAVVGLLCGSAIWADLLPAAGILREVELWHVVKEVTPVAATSGAAATTAQQELVAITLADLVNSLLIAAVALMLLRNLPGLFEVTLFRRLQAGERYAFATIVKYVIAVTGATLAFDAIGIGWSSIQWLVAAVGLGLGFGLQEIFANFVSGIIILLERPIRVGDIVTVGGVSGTVTRIRTRATWITAFDRTELVVPNKEFVTSRLVNWSLSDGVIRADVPVGIAYGSDVQKALTTLQRVANDNPMVLKDPQPQVLFRNFGDSTLGLELRAFIEQPGERPTVLHQLHVAVDAAFREAGIEIAFPQTDLHLRSVPKGFIAGSGES